ACTAPRTPRAHPAVWNIGNGLTTVSPAWISVIIAKYRELFVRPRWVSNAPFGKPVVPDVYWICTGSLGFTSGSCGDAGAVAMKASHSVNRIDSRNAGSAGRTWAKDAAIGFPRNSGTRKIPDEPDWRKTY